MTSSSRGRWLYGHATLAVGLSVDEVRPHEGQPLAPFTLMPILGVYRLLREYREEGWNGWAQAFFHLSLASPKPVVTSL